MSASTYKLATLALFFYLFGFSPNCLAQSYQIGQKSIQPSDPARNGRSVPTEVFYPAQSGGTNVPVANSPEGFPLLVFGHGFSMNFGPYGNLREELVKQGYIMAFPKTEVGPIPFPDHGAFGEDMAFLARLFLQKDTASASDFFQRLNGKIAAMGHSMGGGTSFLAAKNEEAFTALATLAPAETNVSAIGAAASVNIPSLIFAGNEDCVTPIPDHQQPMYDTLAAPCKTLVIIKQGTHCFFANNSLTCDFGSSTCNPSPNINRTDQHQRMFSVLTPWLNFYLKGNCSDYDTIQQALADTSRFTVQRSCSYQLPDVSVNPSDTTLLCPNDSIVFSANKLFSAYHWNTGDTTRKLTVTQNGSFRVIVTDTLGCTDTSETVFAFQKPTFSPDIVNDSLAFLCPGDSLELELVSSYQSYQWSSGDTTPTTVTSQPGTFWIDVVNSSGCTGRSDTVEVVAAAKPVPAIQQNTNSDITLCPKDSVQLSLDSSFASYQWSNGIRSASIEVSQPGNYWAQVTNKAGCVGSTDTVTVSNYAPSKPTIRQMGDSLMTDDFASHQWYLDSTIIPGADQKMLSVADSGSYYVEVTDSNGCVTASDTIHYQPTPVGISETKASDLRVSPNPATDQLHIQVNQPSQQELTLQLISVIGQKIVHNSRLPSGITNKTIRVNDLPAGIYILQISSGQRPLHTRKILVE